MNRYLTALLMIAFATACLAIGLSVNGGNGPVPILLGGVGGFVGVFGIIALVRASFAEAKP